MATRRPFMMPGQQGQAGVANASGAGRPPAGMPMMPQVGRTNAQPPMTGAPNLPGGGGPPGPLPSPGSLPPPLPQEPTAGGPTSPLNIAGMLEPQRPPGPALRPYGDQGMGPDMGMDEEEGNMMGAPPQANPIMLLKLLQALGAI